MTRTRSGSLAAGGLNWDSLPLKLFAGGNAKFWDPADIDFSRDREDWASLSDDERDFATRLCAEFIAGEEAVTEDIQPFILAMRAEGRLGDEMYLTQFAFEEAKHTQVFRLWLDAGAEQELPILKEIVGHRNREVYNYVTVTNDQWALRYLGMEAWQTVQLELIRAGIVSRDGEQTPYEAGPPICPLHG